MNLAALYNSIESPSLFSTRIFFPALLSALLLRFGPDIPVIHHLGLLAYAGHGQPSWFTSNPCLIVLALLSILEILAQKNVEARQLIQEFDLYLKPVLAALTMFGFLSSTDAGFISRTVHQAGYSDVIYPIVTALLTYKLSSVRKSVATVLFDHLEGTGVDRLITWLEEAWTIFGSLLLFIFPLLMLLMIAASTGVLFLLRRRLHVAEDKSQIPCSRCGKSVYPCAVACPGCREKLPNPAAVGFLGQSAAYPAIDLPNHPFRLYEKRRCPLCATRLVARKAFDACPACGDLSHTRPDFIEAYSNYVGRRLAMVLMVCFLMGLVPIFGLIVAVVYYRIEIVLPFSQYLPMGKRFLLRWGIRLLFFVLVFLQIIPLIGAFVAPLMAYISFVAYRQSYLDLVRATPGPQQAIAPAAT